MFSIFERYTKPIFSCQYWKFWQAEDNSFIFYEICFFDLFLAQNQKNAEVFCYLLLKVNEP